MVIGHRDIIADLTRLAEEDRLAHGYLFFGFPGVGRYTTARSYAGYLETGSWDSEGVLCSDALVVSPDGKGTIGIDAVRGIRNFIWQRPAVSRYRTVIIDDAELLTSEAQNALLKIAEEPPSAGLLILIVREPEMLWPTLVSRFQKLYFSPVQETEIETWLCQSGTPPREAKRLAGRSFGRPGLARIIQSDETFQKREEQAREFIALTPSARKAYIKDLVSDESFRLDAFLDMIIFLLAEENGGDRGLWHSVLELRRTTETVNVNSRIQLMALSAFFSEQR